MGNRKKKNGVNKHGSRQQQHGDENGLPADGNNNEKAINDGTDVLVYETETLTLSPSPSTTAEVTTRVAELLDFSSFPLPDRPADLLEYARSLCVLRDLILQLQNDHRFSPECASRYDRMRYVPRFIQWCVDQDIHPRGIEICADEELGESYSGLGLRAARDISSSELLAVVPRSSVLATSAWVGTATGKAANADPILSGMPNVLLSMIVLSEFAQGNRSSFAPYLAILPREYDTVLYWSFEAFQLLSGSPSFEPAVKQLQSILRQFAYFHRLFADRVAPIAQARQPGLNVECFTLAAYRWAVATVSTRINHIPEAANGTFVPCLIPLWDLANHACSPALISTDYDNEKRAVLGYATKEVQKGEQIFTYYGDRTNADFAIHNGFVPSEENHSDAVKVRLALSKADKLYGRRAQALKLLELEPCSDFAILSTSPHIGQKMLQFAAVFCSDKEALDYVVTTALADIRPSVFSSRVRAWEFLTTRLALMARQTRTLIEAAVATGEVGGHKGMLLDLRRSELALLELATRQAQREHGILLKKDDDGKTD